MSVSRGRTLIRLLVPASLTEEKADPKIKTYKVGQIARAAAIFKVDEIVIYKTKRGPDDSRFISAVLQYAETPQYLRKQLFGMQEDLRHAGVIPPLRTPHHPLAGAGIEKDEMEYREGIVASVGSDGSAWVDIGLDSPALLDASPEEMRNIQKGRRVTVRIFSRRPVTVKVVSRREVPHYWGYGVKAVSSLKEALDTDGLRIATSRLGDTLGVEMLSELKQQMSKRDKVSVAFGSPTAGLETLLGYEGCKLKEHSDYVVNAIPGQGAATVRTEEAVFIAMGLLSLIL